VLAIRRNDTTILRSTRLGKHGKRTNQHAGVGLVVSEDSEGTLAVVDAANKLSEIAPSVESHVSVGVETGRVDLIDVAAATMFPQSKQSKRRAWVVSKKLEDAGAILVARLLERSAPGPQAYGRAGVGKRSLQNRQKRALAVEHPAIVHERAQADVLVRGFGRLQQLADSLPWFGMEASVEDAVKVRSSATRRRGQQIEKRKNPNKGGYRLRRHTCFEYLSRALGDWGNWVDSSVGDGSESCALGARSKLDDGTLSEIAVSLHAEAAPQRRRRV